MNKYNGYSEGISKNNREKAILNYLPLVKKIIRKMNAGFLPREKIEDLVSAGVEGLINAVDNFDPINGHFYLYAEIRIKGSIVDYWRKQDTIGRYTRIYLKKIINYIDSRRKISTDPISEEDLYRHLGLSRKRFCNVMKTIGKADITYYADRYSCYESVDPVTSVGAKILKEIVLKEIEKLEPKQRKIILLLFYENKTSIELTKIFNLTEGRISQLRKIALSKLKRRLLPHIQYENQLLL